jgi:hypothetical protein
MGIDGVWWATCSVCGDAGDLVPVPADDRSDEGEVMCARCGQARLLAMAAPASTARSA